MDGRSRHSSAHKIDVGLQIARGEVALFGVKDIRPSKAVLCSTVFVHPTHMILPAAQDSFLDSIVRFRGYHMLLATILLCALLSFLLCWFLPCNA